jgi:hypothetical protein
MGSCRMHTFGVCGASWWAPWQPPALLSPLWRWRWRLRRPLGGLLHRELLGLTGTASQQYCNDKTKDRTHFGVHAPFLILK